MDTFFKVKTREEVFRIIDQFSPVGEETISIEGGLGRVLSEDIVSPEDLPGFSRSAMDGYAVRAKDTFGASESLPAFFEVTGEVPMGQRFNGAVGEGQAVKISTGGMLPKGADGVVMIEYCHHLDASTLEVTRAASPLENIIQATDDYRKGEKVLHKGQALRPQDLGVMAGLGQLEASVYRRPKVAIISTGDEIVSADARTQPGQVRDINRYTLTAFCRRWGAECVHTGLCPDDFELLKSSVDESLEKADTVWISGGSSVGTRDLTLKVFETLQDFELLAHGISISPGKPTIIGRSITKPVIGLPGHVASALVVAEVFLSRLLARLSGKTEGFRGVETGVEAKLSQNIESASGREDYIRVKLVRGEEGFIAEPVFGKSGLISTLAVADGIIQIDMNTEGLYRGQKVSVRLL
jgi:molybdopterin molybdotransferase